MMIQPRKTRKPCEVTIGDYLLKFTNEQGEVLFHDEINRSELKTIVVPSGLDESPVVSSSTPCKETAVVVSTPCASSTTFEAVTPEEALPNKAGVVQGKMSTNFTSAASIAVPRRAVDRVGRVPYVPTMW